MRRTRVYFWFISISEYSLLIMIRPIFICKANVWRSQIAEWIFNHRYGAGTSISIAGCEARKEKYWWVPDTWVSTVLQEYKWVDISNQKIKYLSDITSQQLSDYNLVVFLFDPSQDSSCDYDCKKDWISPYEYLSKLDSSIRIHPITDPFEVWVKEYRRIIDEIDIIIENLVRDRV